jgi:Calx-beta domain/RTX calcium-binding nonapeptide repeat (4 copies)
MNKLPAMIALPRLRLGVLVTGLVLLLSASALAATIVGTAKNEVIRGTAKADKLYGKGGRDKLYGLGGNDVLVGGAGNDTLVGGAGADKLQCGPGHDVAIADAKDRVLADCERVRGPMLPSISINDASVAEGNSGTTPLSFEVRLSRPVTWNVSVAYTTVDGTAKAGSDYAAAQGTVGLLPGETSKMIDVQVTGDTVVEPDETLAISLSGVTNGTIAKSSATGTIKTDDYEWHRLSADRSQTAPEHERFQCAEGSTWTCAYSKVPEPALNFQWNGQRGTFTGLPIPPGHWPCPTWFPSKICANVNRVAQGIASFGPASTFSIREELIVTKTGNHEQMYVYWVGQFVCPWYQTFEEALAANPFPLPFNGTAWPPQDCSFAR